MPMQINRIDPARTALIVVDMQNDFLAPGAPMETIAARAMVPRLAEALALCREVGMHVVYTAHVHRHDDSDMGLMGELYESHRTHAALMEGTPGADIYPALAARPGEPIVTKQRYSGFFATNLDLVLRQWGIDTVIISGTTTENCCHATARDALFRNYRVVFLSDATATFDYPDNGFGAMSSEQVHRATLVVIANSTGHVMSVADLRERLTAAG